MAAAAAAVVVVAAAVGCLVVELLLLARVRRGRLLAQQSCHRLGLAGIRMIQNLLLLLLPPLFLIAAAEGVRVWREGGWTARRLVGAG